MTHLIRNWKHAASVLIASRCMTRRTTVVNKHNIWPGPGPEAENSKAGHQQHEVLSKFRSTDQQSDDLLTLNINRPNSATSDNSFNYELLMLKRSGKSKFMPSAHVYPGGKVSPEDYSEEWIKVFSEAGESDLSKAIPAPQMHVRAPMFTEQSAISAVPNDVAFRLCAIRETFEESGILICRSMSDFANCQWKNGFPTTSAKPLELGNLNRNSLPEWRNSVYQNPSDFVRLCEELALVPDIWSLHEWSNWLTPTNMEKMHSNRRYDTAFYLCILPHRIQAKQDDQEIISAEWLSPSEALKKFHREESWLAPPQVYEMSRLCNFTDIDHLEIFAQERGIKGCERWLPVRTNCTDGIIAVLPGDGLYPEDVDIIGEFPAPTLDMSMDEALAKTKNLHRSEFRSMYNSPVKANIPQKYGHVAPITDEEFIIRFGKK